MLLARFNKVIAGHCHGPFTIAVGLIVQWQQDGFGMKPKSFLQAGGQAFSFPSSRTPILTAKASPHKHCQAKLFTVQCSPFPDNTFDVWCSDLFNIIFSSSALFGISKCTSIAFQPSEPQVPATPRLHTLVP